VLGLSLSLPVQRLSQPGQVFILSEPVVDRAGTAVTLRGGAAVAQRGFVITDIVNRADTAVTDRAGTQVTARLYI